MNDVLFPAVEAAKAISLCEHCQKSFEPRAGSGGKPQRFCSEKCRKAFHKAGDVGVDVGAPAAPPEQKRVVSEPKPETWDFDWSRDKKDVVVPSQPAIAVYFNPRGEVVIRQEGQYHPDEDHWIYIQIENLEPLIDQLQRIASREIKPGD
jgi:hypothetical protein